MKYSLITCDQLAGLGWMLQMHNEVGDVCCMGGRHTAVGGGEGVMFDGAVIALDFAGGNADAQRSCVYIEGDRRIWCWCGRDMVYHCGHFVDVSRLPVITPAFPGELGLEDDDERQQEDGCGGRHLPPQQRQPPANPG